jgi:hypothetical protein
VGGDGVTTKQASELVKNHSRRAKLEAYEEAAKIVKKRFFEALGKQVPAEEWLAGIILAKARELL